MSSHETGILALTTCSMALIMLPSLTEAADLAAKPAPKVELGKLALSFEPNQGQLGSKAVRFLAHGPSCSIALTDSEAVLTLKPGSARDVVRLRVVGAQQGIRAVASTPQSGRVNYLIGSDRSSWLTDVPTYGKVGYTGVYPGIDLVITAIRDGWSTTLSSQPAQAPRRSRFASPAHAKWSSTARVTCESRLRAAGLSSSAR